MHDSPSQLLTACVPTLHLHLSKGLLALHRATITEIELLLRYGLAGIADGKPVKRETNVRLITQKSIVNYHKYLAKFRRPLTDCQMYDNHAFSIWVISQTHVNKMYWSVKSALVSQTHQKLCILHYDKL